jgi:DUF4097 and DUF4098 domain-containing protein YvlB
MGQVSQDQRIETFATPRPVRLRVAIAMGRIRVAAAPVQTTRVILTALHGDSRARELIAAAEITQNGDDILVRIEDRGFTFRLFSRGTIEAVIEVPQESAVSLSTGSGHIETLGRLGEVKAESGSGAIHLEAGSEVRARAGSGEIAIMRASGSVDAKTGSGRVKVGKVGANARIATASGHVEIDEASGSAWLTTASGHIEIGRAGDALDAIASSGNVLVHHADHGRVNARSMSGRVSVGVPKGVAALLDISTMSGSVVSDLDSVDAPGAGYGQVELHLRTMSGTVHVARA